LLAAGLGIIVVHEDFVVCVFCIDVDVVCLPELLEVKALDEMLVDELKYLLGVEEAHSTNVDEVLHEYLVLVGGSFFLFLLVLVVPIQKRSAFRAADVELRLLRGLAALVLLLLPNARVSHPLILPVLRVDDGADRVVLREDEVIDQLLLLYHSALGPDEARVLLHRIVDVRIRGSKHVIK